MKFLASVGMFEFLSSAVAFRKLRKYKVLIATSRLDCDSPELGEEVSHLGVFV